jgi:hypothetical protein
MSKGKHGELRSDMCKELEFDKLAEGGSMMGTQVSSNRGGIRSSIMERRALHASGKSNNEALEILTSGNKDSRLSSIATKTVRSKRHKSLNEDRKLPTKPAEIF